MAKINRRAAETLRDLDRMSRAYFSNLSPAEQDVIKRHVSGGFAEITTKPEGDALEEIISRAPRVPGDLYLYRASNVPLPRRAQSHYPIPTTANPGIARSFYDDALGHLDDDAPSSPRPIPRIESLLLPEGSPGLWLGIPGLNFPEKEMVLPRGGLFTPRIDRYDSPAWEELFRILDQLDIPNSDKQSAGGVRLDQVYDYEPPFKARGGILRRLSHVR